LQPAPCRGRAPKATVEAAHARHLDKVLRIKVSVSPIAPVVVAQKPKYTALLNFEDAGAGCGLERFLNTNAWLPGRRRAQFRITRGPLLNGKRGCQHGAARRCRAAADHMFAVEEKADSDPGLPASPLLSFRGPVFDSQQ
jgi:hypothetical protein